MPNYLTIAIVLVSTVTTVSCITSAVAEPPIGMVSIVEDEIEIVSAPIAMVTVDESEIEIEYINFSE